MKEVVIYSDGACSGNPGPGGWAAVLVYGQHSKEISGFIPETTNNRMEIFSAIQGLRCLKEPCVVRMYSDSSYLVNAFLNGWLRKWQSNGWHKADKSPVENQDLWQQLLVSMNGHTVTWHKVKGHADNDMNNRCDALARGQVDAWLKIRKAEAAKKVDELL